MGIQDLTGQTLGQYELRELLGLGGMGAVYRGYQTNLKRYVAVKIMTPQLAEQSGYIERFTREAETAAQLEHRHIVPIYDYGAQRGITYVVMRLLTGGALSDRLTQHKQDGVPLPSLGETTEVISQLASALDYAHAQGVIHRDIKPSNVMFDNQGSAYLVDFGIAKLISERTSLTASGVVIGTWAYMAPEQWKVEDITPATDQYALAVMAYSLVTGRLPFEAPTPAGIMHKHLNELPTPPQTVRPDVPADLSGVLNRAMAKAPGERFPTCTAFAQAFGSVSRASAGERTSFFTAPVRRQRPSLFPTPGEGASQSGSGSISASLANITRSLSRRPATWFAALVMLIIVAVALGSGVFSGGDADDSAGSQIERTAIALQTAQAGFSATQTVLAAPARTLSQSEILLQTLTAVYLTEEADRFRPTVTAAPSVTNTRAAPIVLLTVTSEPPTVYAPTDVVLRGGPSAAYAPIGTLDTGQTADVIGRNAAGGWWAIEYGGQTGWVSADDVNTGGSVGSVPVLAAPTLTPEPSATASTTASSTPTHTPTVTVTATATFTGTPTHTVTASPSATASPTATASATATRTVTASHTATATATFTTVPTETPSATPTATLAPTNAPPAIAPIADQVVMVGEISMLYWTATDVDGQIVGQLVESSDPTVLLVGRYGSDDSVELTGLKEGTVTLVVTVGDDAGARASQTLRVTVVTPPTATAVIQPTFTLTLEPTLTQYALPTTAPSVSAATDACIYTVQPGDTLFSVATAYQVTVADLVAANADVLSFGADTPIQPGWTLVIPSCVAEPTLVPTAVAAVPEVQYAAAAVSLPSCAVNVNPVPAGVTLAQIGPLGVEARAAPARTAERVTRLRGETVYVTGRTEDGSWLRIQDVMSTLWIEYSQVVTLSDSLDRITIVAPAMWQRPDLSGDVLGYVLSDETVMVNGYTLDADNQLWWRVDQTTDGSGTGYAWLRAQPLLNAASCAEIPDSVALGAINAPEPVVVPTNVPAQIAMLSEDEACTVALESVVPQARTACSSLDSNQLCYASGGVSAERWSASDAAPFAVPGDRINLDTVSALRTVGLTSTDNVPGIALMSVPFAGVNQASTMVLFGDAVLETAQSQRPTVEVEVDRAQNINVRQGPSADTPVIATLRPGERVAADGRLADSSWLRIQLPDRNVVGWVWAELLAFSDNIELLEIAGDVDQDDFPLRNIYLTTADSPVNAACPQMAAGGLLVQSPRLRTLYLSLTVNDVTLYVQGTALLEAPDGRELIVSVLDGRSYVETVGGQRAVPAGARLHVALGDGIAAVTLEVPVPYDTAVAHGLPLDLLGQSVEVQAPLDQTQLTETVAELNQCTVLLLTDSALRSGPGPAFPEIQVFTLTPGVTRPVLGQHTADGVWLKVLVYAGRRAWLPREAGHNLGDCSTVPEGEPPVAPTRITANQPVPFGGEGNVFNIHDCNSRAWWTSSNFGVVVSISHAANYTTAEAAEAANTGAWLTVNGQQYTVTRTGYFYADNQYHYINYFDVGELPEGTYFVQSATYRASSFVKDCMVIVD